MVRRPVPVSPSWLQRLAKVARSRGGLMDFERERLGEAIASLRVEMESRKDVAPERWASAANAHASRAERLFEKRQIDASWTACKAASRELIEAYTEAELLLEAERLRSEAASKLRGWRGEAVSAALSPTWKRVAEASQLQARINKAVGESQSKDDRMTLLRQNVLAALGQAGEQNEALETTELRARVKVARAILDDHLDNIYRKLAILGKNLRRAGWLLFVVLLLAAGLIVLALELGEGSDAVASIFRNSKSVAVVLVLGALGGATSGLVTLLGHEAQARIPDVLAKRYLIWLRPLTGAAAALGVITILRAGLGGARIAPEVTFAVAFVAGFSERLVSRAVESASAAISS